MTIDGVQISDTERLRVYRADLYARQYTHVAVTTQMLNRAIYFNTPQLIPSGQQTTPKEAA